MISSSAHATKNLETKKNEILGSYNNIKKKMLSSELNQRKVLSSLYLINKKIKRFSSKRGRLNDQMLGVESSVKTLSHEIAKLEMLIESQKKVLSKRLRILYKIGSQEIVRILFSSESSIDLDKKLKYLKLLSEQDYEFIKKYKENRDNLIKKRNHLKIEIKELMLAKIKFKKQEILLEKEEKKKSRILSSLKKRKKTYLKELKKYKSIAKDFEKDFSAGVTSVMNTSFFENKGSLSPPLMASREEQSYGLVQNDKYNYQLNHKGIIFESEGEGEVFSVFDGQVSFVGDLQGYGNIIVIDHGGHYYSVYAGIGDVDIKEKENVEKGQRIGKLSSKKLYFEVRHFSDAINPKEWLNGIPEPNSIGHGPSENKRL